MRPGLLLKYYIPQKGNLMAKQSANVSGAISYSNLFTWLGVFLVVAVITVIVLVGPKDSPPEGIKKDAGRTNINIAADIEKGLNQILSVEAAVGDADNLLDEAICLTGFYEGSPDLSIMGSTFSIADDGRRHVDSEAIVWTPIDTPLYSEIECGDGGRCFGSISACGKFKMAADGAFGFGPEGDYQYSLEPLPAGIKGCIEDNDCSMNTCSGCFNNNYLNDPFRDEALCPLWDGYTCICVNKICTEIHPRDLYQFGR